MNESAAFASAADSTTPLNACPRVLAVDDQPDALRLLQLRITAVGMECFAFSDGPTALAFLEEELVDVVILDVMMPRMDGYEVCRRIKADARTRDIPVIFLTAKTGSEDKIQGLEMGGHDYLGKPVQQQELMARTKAALRVKQLQDQLKHQIKLQEQVHQLHRGMISDHWQKTLGQLAASLAHEINNPLAAALGMVQLLKLKEGQDGETKQRLQAVDTSLQRAAQKLRSLLLIAHVGRHPERVVLAGLIEDLITLTNYQLVMNKVSLTTELDRACEWEGIPSELGRILLYLLNNSLEAVTGRPDAAIKIALQNSGLRLLIRISDNGTGIDDSVSSRVFEPFFTTKGSSHNGLGLYMANEIARELGGAIEFQSPAANASTSFVISLPRNCRPS